MAPGGCAELLKYLAPTDKAEDRSKGHLLRPHRGASRCGRGWYMRPGLHDYRGRAAAIPWIGFFESSPLAGNQLFYQSRGQRIDTVVVAFCEQ